METDLLAGYNDDDRRLVDEFRSICSWEFGGTDIVANMLRTSSGDLNEVDPDWVGELAQLIRTLATLCGSENSACMWLIHSDVYTKINGNGPYYCLEHGSFWSISVMLEWVAIMKAYAPPELISTLFNSRDT